MNIIYNCWINTITVCTVEVSLKLKITKIISNWNHIVNVTLKALVIVYVNL